MGLWCVFFFFKQKTAYEVLRSLVGSEMCIRDRADLIKIFLPVVDDLERALKNKPSDPEAEPWISGIALILQKLMKTLDAKGVSALDVQPGDDFDPAFQEAVTHEEDPEYRDSQVIEVVQTGYKLKDRVIRPALVRVAK